MPHLKLLSSTAQFQDKGVVVPVSAEDLLDQDMGWCNLDLDKGH